MRGEGGGLVHLPALVRGEGGGLVHLPALVRGEGGGWSTCLHW